MGGYYPLNIDIAGYLSALRKLNWAEMYGPFLASLPPAEYMMYTENIQNAKNPLTGI